MGKAQRVQMLYSEVRDNRDVTKKYVQIGSNEMMAQGKKTTRVAWW